MIITAGEFRGRKIFCPTGKDIRPTSSKIRQAIFNILYSMGFDMNGVTVLELFSGTGVVSIESISRGASKAIIVDNSSKASTCAEKNIDHLDINNRISFIKQDAVAYVKNADLSVFDLIFIDPPYRYENYDQLMGIVMSKINMDSIVLLESNRVIIDKNNEINADILKTGNWGKTFVSFLRRKKINNF